MKTLLHRPAVSILADLDLLLEATSKAMPLSKAHRHELPYAVRDLSRILTSERVELHRPYWAAPRFLAAYLAYFLPWNIYRLAWLLPGFSFLPPMENASAPIRILDLGSGPLTLPLAIWCTRPDLRDKPLHFICTDSSVQPLRAGFGILKQLWGGSPVWRVDIVKEHLDGALSHGGESFDCIISGNVLNELSPPRTGLLEDRVEGIMRRVRRKLRPHGRAFFLEPGTRLGGKMISLARKGGLLNGLIPLAPCTHSGPCPTLATGTILDTFDEDLSKSSKPNLFQNKKNETGYRKTYKKNIEANKPLPYTRANETGANFSGWCHFVHPVLEDVPRELLRLTSAARLEKQQFSLSCLLLEHNGNLEATAPKDAFVQSDLSLEGGLADNDGALGIELADLEALYQEMLEEDRQEIVNYSRSTVNNSASKNRPDRVYSNSSDISASTETGTQGFGRIISQPIRLPQEEEPARYACTPWGLGLVLEGTSFYSGAEVPLSLPDKDIRDQKSGARIFRVSAKELGGGRK